MTHDELCCLTGKRFFKDYDLVLFNCACATSSEQPDVICFKGLYSSVFEIKISKADFRADSKKLCRKQYVWWKREFVPDRSMVGVYDTISLKEFLEKTKNKHLGTTRYYICPWELIQPDEIKNGWGLYWFKNGRFFRKKNSSYFKNDANVEKMIIINAFRKWGCGYKDNILLKCNF